MNINALVGGLPSVAEHPAPSSGGTTSDNGFGRIVAQLLDNVAAPARSAEQAVNDLAVGKTDNLHGVLLAVAQADLAFRIALEIRNKLMDAYQEIQRMQV
jgi:flagellar hook-basal body complex protein FliE